MRRECRDCFPPPSQVSDPDMHHATWVTHVPWCMPGSLTSSFLRSRWWGKRSQHPRRMRNPQFYLSGKRTMEEVWEHVSIHWQQSKCQLWANCFLGSVVSNPWSLGPISTSDKTPYCKISQILEAARFVFRIVRSVWNLTDIPTAMLARCLSNFNAM